MRKPKPIDLEMSITDSQFLQDRVNYIFLEIIKYTLNNSSATHKEKLLYIDSIIKALKSG